MRIIIVGGGRVGKRLAKLLTKETHDVVVVEKELELARRLSSELDALILAGDATEERILLDAGIKRADCLVTTTRDDEVNLLVAEKAKKFGVQKVISRISDPENYEFFLKLETIPMDVTTEIVSTIHNAITSPERQILTPVCGGKAYIVRLLVKGSSPNLGKKISKVDFKENIICVERNKKLIPLEKDEILLENDIIYALARPEEIKKMFKVFTGGTE